MRESVKLLIAVLAGAALTGCSVDGDITDETRRIATPRMATLSGVVPGAQHNVRTVGGYSVSATVGAPFHAKAEEVTSGGYKVYSNVQGNINSETYEITRQ